MRLWSGSDQRRQGAARHLMAAAAAWAAGQGAQGFRRRGHKGQRRGPRALQRSGHEAKCRDITTARTDPGRPRHEASPNPLPRSRPAAPGRRGGAACPDPAATRHPHGRRHQRARRPSDRPPARSRDGKIPGTPHRRPGQPHRLAHRPAAGHHHADAEPEDRGRGRRLQRRLRMPRRRLRRLRLPLRPARPARTRHACRPRRLPLPRRPPRQGRGGDAAGQPQPDRGFRADHPRRPAATRRRAGDQRATPWPASPPALCPGTAPPPKRAIRAGAGRRHRRPARSRRPCRARRSGLRLGQIHAATGRLSLARRAFRPG